MVVVVVVVVVGMALDELNSPYLLYLFHSMN